MSWLDCNTEKEGTKKVVTTLKCRVCTEFVSKIRGRKKFSKKMDTVMTLIIQTKLTNFISGVRILQNTIINNFSWKGGGGMFEQLEDLLELLDL